MVWALLGVIDGLWLVALSIAWARQTLQLIELRRDLAMLGVRAATVSRRSQQPLRAGYPDIGTPPLIPPPYDAE